LSGHPGTNCIACHNPHEHETGDFLVKNQGDLCRTCHAEQHSLAGGPHDAAQRAETWSKVSQGSTDGPCLTCHVAHGTKASGLFSFDAQADGNHDSACLHCHAETAWGAPTDIAAIHPQKINPVQKRVPVSLVPSDSNGNMRMGCRTCHNPHGGAEPGHLARVASDEPTAALCTHCHEDKKLIEMTGHATAKLAELGFNTDSCKPCHAMHAKPSDAWGQMLSSRFLTANLPNSTQPAELQPAIDQQYDHEAAVPCLVCHHAGGPAPVRDVATHPPVTLVNIVKPDAPGYMPLFGGDGKVSENGQITCRTCHLSHGQTQLLKQAVNNGNLSPDEQQSARMQLRPFVAPNLCTQCHGNQGRLKFLFFHNLEQRSGSRQ
jgi:predicted CXXCH cytochrome family protein